MGKRTRYEPGTFSWVELATTDARGAKGFYGALFGWEPEDVPIDDTATYTMLNLGGDPVAALYQQPEEQRSAGAPPSWLSYVTVDSVDEVALRAPQLGGTVAAQPFDVLESGRMALIQDPTGAALALWEPRAHIGASRVNDRGCLCWNDLITPDPSSAERFYERLLGWDVEELEGAEGYRVVRNAGRSNGGMMPASLTGSGGASPHWLPYFNAGDLDEVVARMNERGGRVIAGPRRVPAGRFAVAEDPQGAVFGLVEGEVDD